MFSISRPPRPGFTRVDLLVVSALMLLTFGVAIPAAQKAREAADRVKCQNNLKQLGLASIWCHDQVGTLPPSVGPYVNENSAGTVFFYILSYLDQDKIYKNATDGDGNHSVWINNTYSATIPTYFCPSDASAGDQHRYGGWLATSSYAANHLVLGQQNMTLAKIIDGCSQTLFFAERYQVCNQTPCGWAYSVESEWAPVLAYSSVAVFQSQPMQARCNPALGQSNHANGIQVCMGDGSARTVGPMISPRTWFCLCCPNDGEIIDVTNLE